MNEAFPSSSEMVLRNGRQQSAAARGWRRSFRKRRANSDGDIPPITVENYVPHGVSDDSVIDIMSDSLSEHHMSLHKATMDPSQMFIPYKRKSSLSTRNSFVRSPSPQDVSSSSININSLDMIPSDPSLTELNNGTSVILDDLQNNTDAIFPTQFYYLHTNLTDPISTVENSSEEIIGENFYTEVEAPPRHIPAKYSRKPEHLRHKHLMQPHVEEVTSHVNQQWITHKADKDDLLEKGIEWKNGTWSLAEEEILRGNIDNYCEENNIVDPTLMIFTSSKDTRKKFYRIIANGLNRPLFSVYRKVTRMYDTRNYRGKYTKEEEMKLMELAVTLSCNWVTIGEQLGRSANSVKDKYRLLCNAKNKGKWEEWEKAELSKSVHELTNTKRGESVTTGINWLKVSQAVGTRTEKQCYNKWIDTLNWKEAGGKPWLNTDGIELINRISNSGVSDELQLDWNQLSNNWACVRSPQWLRKKWEKIKKNVPDHYKVTFQDQLDYLKTNYVNSIWEKCKKRLADKKSYVKDETYQQHQQQQQHHHQQHSQHQLQSILQSTNYQTQHFSQTTSNCNNSLNRDNKNTNFISTESTKNGLSIVGGSSTTTSTKTNLLIVDTGGEEQSRIALIKPIHPDVPTSPEMSFTVTGQSGMESLQQAIEIRTSPTFENSLSVVEGRDRMISETCDQQAASPLFQS